MAVERVPVLTEFLLPMEFVLVLVQQVVQEHIRAVPEGIIQLVQQVLLQPLKRVPQEPLQVVVVLVLHHGLVSLAVLVRLVKLSFK